MAKITRVPFNYDDESWTISSRGYVPPRRERPVSPDKADTEPPEPEDQEPAEKG